MSNSSSRNYRFFIPTHFPNGKYFLWFFLKWAVGKIIKKSNFHLGDNINLCVFFSFENFFPLHLDEKKMKKQQMIRSKKSWTKAIKETTRLKQTTEGKINLNKNRKKRTTKKKIEDGKTKTTSQLILKKLLGIQRKELEKEKKVYKKLTERLIEIYVCFSKLVEVTSILKSWYFFKKENWYYIKLQISS